MKAKLTVTMVCLVAMRVGACAQIAASPGSPVGAGHVAMRSAGDIGAQLDNALDGKTPLSEVKVNVMWAGKLAQIDSPELGIWNRNCPFKPGEATVRKLLQACKDADFANMQRVYGRVRIPRRAGRPVQLKGSISVQIGDVGKSVMQQGGETKAPFAQLADKLLKICETAAAGAQPVTDLSAGLAGIANGKIPAQLLDVTLIQMPERRRGRASRYLYVRKGAARATSGRDRKMLPLTEGDLRAIAKVLVDNAAVDLPRQLYSKGMTQLNIELLGKKKSIQARAIFRNVGPETHGEKQDQFEEIVTSLEGLRDRVMKEGAPEPRRKGHRIHLDPDRKIRAIGH